MFAPTRLSQWGLAFALSVSTLGIAPDMAQAQNTPVYIDDSPAAMDQLTEAIRLRSQNRLTESVTKYQYILETYRHKLMQTDKPYFTDTRRLVVGRLLADEPLLSTYRKQYEASAKRMLIQSSAASDRLSAMLAVVDRYFLCPSGMQAGLDAAGLLLANADIPAAMALLEQLAVHPDRQAEAARYEALLSTCRMLINPIMEIDGPQAVKPLDLTPGTVIPPVTSPMSQIGQSGWALPGLPPDVTQLWSIALPNPFVADEGKSGGRRVFRNQRDLNLPTAVEGNLIPMIQADRLFVNTQIGVNAYDRLSGRPLWQYQLDNDATATSNIMSTAPLDQQRSVCVTEDRVLSIVGVMTQWRATMNLKNHQTHLVCLDMNTGTLLWDTQPDTLDESLEEVFFHGTPLADDRRVYVLMRRSQNSGFHTVYLAALDLTDGHLLWKRHLASAAMGNNNRTYALGEMTLYQGQIYVTDNLGTVSAIDGLSGDMLWLVMLDRTPDSSDLEPKPLVAQRRRIITSSSRPAPIVTSSKVLVSPAWANEPAQVIDRLTGNPLRKLDDKGFDTGSQLTLTRFGLLSVDHTVRLYDSDTFERKWERKLKGITDKEKPQYLVHDDKVMVQGDGKLYTLNLKDGLIESELPFDQEGIILTADEQWIVSRGDELISLMRWEDAYNQLVARIDRYPNQAWPGLALSHLAVNRAQWNTVLQGIDAAINTINLTPATPANSSQQQQIQQVFDHVRSLVELPSEGIKDPQLAQSKLSELPDHLMMMSLFERLAILSMTPVNEVTQQFARGRYWQYRGQSGMAIENYQNVLADPTLASQLYQFDQGARQARLEARLRLIEIVTTDPATMTRFEAVAAEHLNQLQLMPATTADSYLALAESYPLTQAAAKARIAAGQQYWQQGDIQQAVNQLQQAYHQANAHQTKQQIVGQLAEGYQQLGNAQRAHRVLNNFALLFPNEPVWREGKLVSIDAWISELAHAHPLQSRYPSYELPLAQALGLNGRLMLPTQGTADVHTRDLLLLRDETLCLYQLDEKRVIWSLPVTDPQVQLLAQSAEQLLLWHPRQGLLVGINSRTGQALWEPVSLTGQVQSVAQQTNRLAMEPDVQRQWMQMMNPNGLMVVGGRIREARHEVDLALRMAVTPNILIAADGTGRVLAIDRNTGITLWKRLYPLDILDLLAVTDTSLAIGGRVGLPNDTTSHRMLVVDLPTGEPIMHPIEEKDALQWLGIVNPDLLISVTDDIIAAHRIGTGEIVWRLPNPGTPILTPGSPTPTPGSAPGIAVSTSQAQVMLFKDTRGTFTSIDLTTGQTNGSWLAGGSEQSPIPQLRLAEDRFFLLSPTQLTANDLAGNLLWHDGINTTTQYLLAMQLSDQYLVLLTRKDQGWANGESPDAMIDQPIHAPNVPQQAMIPDRRLNRPDEAAFEDATGQYRYQIILMDRTNGRIVHEQPLAPMPTPLLPSASLLCDHNLILSTATQTIIIPSGGKP